MNIKKQINITMTEAEATDFALVELNYQATLTRPITVVDVEATEDTPATTHFDVEEYANPVSIQETIDQAIESTLDKAVDGLLAPYKARKATEALAEVTVTYEGAKEVARLALETRQSEVVTIVDVN